METTLYQPIKNFLETRGYSVKGEIGGCDIVALSDDEPPLVVVCELKLSFNLELILQAVDRASAGDEVWVAARVSGRPWSAQSAIMCTPTRPLVVRPQTKKPANSSQKVRVRAARKSAPNAPRRAPAPPVGGAS